MTLPTYYGQVTFYAKGADSVMQQRVSRSEWLEEEVASLAREGLRTLVLASRQLSPSQLERFRAALAAARLGQHGAPASAVAAVWEDLMRQEGMTLLAVTAVEDKLQSNVRTRVTHSRHTRGTRDMHEAAAPTAAPTCCRLQSHVLQAAAIPRAAGCSPHMLCATGCVRAPRSRRHGCTYHGSTHHRCARRSRPCARPTCACGC